MSAHDEWKRTTSETLQRFTNNTIPDLEKRTRELELGQVSEDDFKKLKEENAKLKSYRRFAEQRILGTSHE
jgi:hypothetical protein